MRLSRKFETEEPLRSPSPSLGYSAVLPYNLFLRYFLSQIQTFHVTRFSPPDSDFFPLRDFIARKELLKMQPHPAASLCHRIIEYKAGRDSEIIRSISMPTGKFNYN